ncbi:MAG: precorrin-6B C5,15-methyltransferase / cobalt-precorrin-6B C5,C15-methyltransferase, partial [Pseudonocardiales bacterium]|nr:precorrin-6B C5,15-methyltransferase / cobalt-precorrin-6B C5,C15-methyltransferase [Pseudonocardiales bacterium]
MTVTVIGVSAADTLSADAIGALQSARLVVGSRDNLARAAIGDDVERIELGPLAPAIDRLRSSDLPAAVVASGDPGLFGIARVLRESGIDVRVLPAVSSVAAAFARVG